VSSLISCPSCAPVQVARELVSGVGLVSHGVMAVAPFVVALLLAMLIVRILDRRGPR